MNELSISEIIDYLSARFKYADHSDRKRLAALLNLNYSMSEVKEKQVDITNSADMLKYVGRTLGVLDTLLEQLTSQGLSANPADLYKLVDTMKNVVAMFSKFGEDIMNQDRIKKIEEAVVTTVKDLDKEVQEKFYERLENLLSE